MNSVSVTRVIYQPIGHTPTSHNPILPNRRDGQRRRQPLIPDPDPARPVLIHPPDGPRPVLLLHRAQPLAIARRLHPNRRRSANAHRERERVALRAAPLLHALREDLAEALPRGWGGVEEARKEEEENVPRGEVERAVLVRARVQDGVDPVERFGQFVPAPV